MALLEAVESGHSHLLDLRHELDRVRETLDRTDAVLGVADDAFARAESGIEASRRVLPVVAVGLAAVAVTVVAVAIWRRSRSRRDPLAQ